MWSWISVLCQLASASEDFYGARFYFGDMHVHTGVSGDGCSSDLEGGGADCGAAADVVALALGNGLDFFVSSDHTNGTFVSMPAAFAAQRDRVLAGNDPMGDFVTLFGAEIDLELEDGHPLGHKTLVFFGDNSVISDVTLPDTWVGVDAGRAVESCAAVWDWATALESSFGDMLLIPHHPALVLPMVTDWSCFDEHFSPVVEVYSRHGDSMGGPDSFDPPWSGSRSDSTVTQALHPEGFGLRLGFVGGTDSHDTAPGATCERDAAHEQLPYGGGLTVVVMHDGDVFDRAAIFDALVARRTYATSGPMVPVVVTWLTGGAVLGGLGETLYLPLGQPLDVAVAIPGYAASAVREVSLYGPDGQRSMYEQEDGLWMVRLAPDEVEVWQYVDVTVDGRAWYGPNGCDDGGEDEAEHLWLSPSQVELGEPDLDRDGVTYADGDCDDGDATFAPDMAEICLGDQDEDCDGLVDDRDPDCFITDPPTGRTPHGTAESADEDSVSSRGRPDLAPEAITCGVAGPRSGLGLLVAGMLLVLLHARRRNEVA